MDKYICRIKRGILYLPEELELPESMIVSMHKDEFKMYTLEAWDEFFKSLSAIGGADAVALRRHVVQCAMQIYISADKRIPLADPWLRLLQDGEAELTWDGKIVVVKTVKDM